MVNSAVKKEIMSKVNKLKQEIEKFIEIKTEEMENVFVLKITGKTIKELRKFGMDDVGVTWEIRERYEKQIKAKIGINPDELEKKVNKIFDKYDYARAIGEEPELAAIVKKISGMLEETQNKMKEFKI
jgi:hypothetical protein